MTTNNNSTTNNSTTEQRWHKELDKKIKSMKGVSNVLPERSLRRIKYSDDTSFYESIN